MRFKALSFRGFGPYKDAQSIIFPGHQKVLICGTNGAGKSFLLDTIPTALFKTIPNRKGSFYDHFSGNDAFIDLTFEFHGHTYRIKRLVNAISRTQKAYFFKGGQPLTEGKGKELDEEIAKLGLDERTFLAAVYQAQTGVGNVLNLPTDERIQLLSTILNLLEFDADYAKVTEAHRDQKRHIDRLWTERTALENQLQDGEKLSADKASHQASVKLYEQDGQALEADYQAAVNKVAAAQANAQGLDEIKRQISELEADWQVNSDEQNSLKEKLANNKNLLLSRKEEIRSAVAKEQTLVEAIRG
ncbi:MAG: AAA family ATPase, partial [Endozoicomonas sp.]